MKHSMTKIFLLCGSFLLSSCSFFLLPLIGMDPDEDYDSSISIKNNSNDLLYFEEGFVPKEKDSIFGFSSFHLNAVSTIKPKSKFSYGRNYMKGLECANLHVILISQGELGRHGADAVIRDKIVEKRYIFTKEQIVKSGGVEIVYDGMDGE